MKSSIFQILSHFSLYMSNISIFQVLYACFRNFISNIALYIFLFCFFNIHITTSTHIKSPTTITMVNHLFCHATINTDVFTCDKACFFRAKKQYHIGNIHRIPTRWTDCCTASAPVYSIKSVSIHPGEIELTRTLPARLTANAWVNAEIPPLAAV